MIDGSSPKSSGREVSEEESRGVFLQTVKDDEDDDLVSGLYFLMDLKEELDSYHRMTNDPKALRLRERIIWKLDAVELEIEQRKAAGKWSGGKRLPASSNSDTTALDEEIIECIDLCLTSFGKNIAYTVYLNWSAVDRQNHKGILGDPKGFISSIHELFGEKGKMVEKALVDSILKRFSYLLTPGEDGRDHQSFTFDGLVRHLRSTGSAALHNRVFLEGYTRSNGREKPGSLSAKDAGI